MRLQRLLLGLICAGALAAGGASAQEVTVEGAWVRGTVAGQTATGAYMNLTSKSDAVLVGVSTAAAGVVEIHEMKMEGNVMKMRALPKLPLPAGKTVRLDDSSSYHVMLMDLKQPVKKGETVVLTLKIEHAGKKSETVKVNASVRALGESEPAPAAESEHQHHHDHQ